MMVEVQRTISLVRPACGVYIVLGCAHIGLRQTFFCVALFLEKREGYPCGHNELFLSN